MIPLAITGAGILSALGIGAELNFARFGEVGIILDRPALKSFDASKIDAPLYEIPEFDAAKFLGDKGLRTLDRLTKLLVVAARLTLEDAGIKKAGAFTALSAERVGVCCSNAYGSLEAITELDRVAVLEDPRYINPAKFPNTVSNSAAGYISIWEELRALNVSVSDGNCGGLDAVFAAALFLETSRADAIITGGGEAMSEALYLAFERLGAFAAGARLGEGAAFFALEPVEKAALRGARTLGVVFGYGTAFFAPEPEVTLLHASKEALSRAIRGALADGAVSADDVDIVVSGESGVAAFDEAEAAAIHESLGDRAVLAPKRLLGETLGAGGALGLAAALAALRDGTPASSLGTLVRGVAPEHRRTALVTALGYHGNASALLVRCRAPNHKVVNQELARAPAGRTSQLADTDRPRRSRGRS